MLRVLIMLFLDSMLAMHAYLWNPSFDLLIKWKSGAKKLLLVHGVCITSAAKVLGSTDDCITSDL